MRVTNLRNWPAIIFGVLLVGMPLLQTVNQYYTFLMTKALIFALFALAFDFVFGYSGLPSFGHAAMFGVGAYAGAFLLNTTSTNLVIVFAAAIIAGALVASIIGWLSTRATGIYFAILTLAFAQLVYIAVVRDIPALVSGADSITGGSDGLSSVNSLELFSIQITSPLEYYYLVLICVAVSYVLVKKMANSPFGSVLEGIRENEDRISAMGYNTVTYKVTAFSISGGFTALAGVLFFSIQTIAYPDMLHWLLSGEIIVMSLIGGLGSLWGPMLGAGLVTILGDLLTGIQNWEIILGSIYILTVLFFPTGIAGLWEDEEQSTNIIQLIRSYLQ